MSDAPESGEEGPPWPKGRYDWIGTVMPLLGHSDGTTLFACEDCGAVVRSGDRRLHDRHHATQNHVAKAIGVLVVSHIGERPHAKYDVMERIGQNPAAWIGHKEIAHFAAEHMVDDEPPLCPSCGFDGRQANVYRKGELWDSCSDPWHEAPHIASTLEEGRSDD